MYRCSRSPGSAAIGKVARRLGVAKNQVHWRAYVWEALLSWLDKAMELNRRAVWQLYMGVMKETLNGVRKVRLRPFSRGVVLVLGDGNGSGHSSPFLWLALTSRLVPPQEMELEGLSDEQIDDNIQFLQQVSQSVER